MLKTTRITAFLFAFIGISTAAYAQLPPTNTYGLDFAANNQQTVSPANHLRLRYNSATGQLEQSISSGSYFSLANAANVVYATAYGVTCNGSTDDTAAIIAMFTVTPAGSLVTFPSGTCVVSNTVTISKPYTHVTGTGNGATTFKFLPTTTATLFKYSAGVAELGGCSLSNVNIISTPANAQIKTAIDLVDTDGFELSNIYIGPNPASTPWTGGGASIGLHLEGRQLTTTNNIRIAADRPVVFSDNPNTSGIVDNDHTHMTDSYLLPTPGSGNAAILIDNIAGVGPIITNLTIDGYQSWIVDKYGLFWVDTGSTSISDAVSINNVRCEQAVDATGYCVYIDRTGSSLNGLYIDNMITGLNHNGIHLNGIQNTQISNSQFTANSSSNTHLDLGTSMFGLQLTNNYVQVNALTNFNGMALVDGAPRLFTAATMPSTASYVDSATYSGRGFNMSSTVSNINSHFYNSGTANTVPLIFDTVNAFSAGSGMVWFYNAGVQELAVTNGGNLLSVGGVYDTLNATQLHLGDINASSVNIGRSTGGAVNISAPTLVPNGTVSNGTAAASWSGTFTKHLAGAGTAPTIAVGSVTQLGTGPAAAVTVGSDVAGTVTITTGTTPAAFVANTAVIVGTVSFNVTYSTTPKMVGLDPANAAASAAASGATGVVFFVDQASTTTGQFVIKAIDSGIGTLPASTALQFVYMVVQ